MASESEDIDLELLENAGRASAIQDLAAKAKELSDRSQALEETTIKETARNNEILKFQNRVLIFVTICLLFLQFFFGYTIMFVNGPNIESIKDTVEGPLSNANAKLDDINVFIAGIKEANKDLPATPVQLQKIVNDLQDVKNILCSQEPTKTGCEQKPK